MTVAAYTVAQAATETPRQIEYRLFAKVTKALIDAEQGSRSDLVRALTWNRRLWLTLQADCARDENRLPETIRAGIISLALWVERHTRMVLKGDGRTEPLIAVNRSIMEGLAGRP